MTQPSPPELSGVRLKLARAQVHIDAIRATVQEFVEQDPPPFGFRSEQRPMGVRAVEYTQYAIVREQPPRALAPMIGDAVHNIRSALDHLAYELAPARARKSGKTQFPIFTDEAGYRERGEPRIKGIIGDERTLIERVQPWYAMPERPKQDPLAVLNRLSNLDKHRLLVPVIAEVAYNQVYVGSDGADVEITYVHPGAVTHGDKVVAFTASPREPGGEMTIEAGSGLQIALSKADIGTQWNRSVDELLLVLHHHVAHSVIDMWFKYGRLPSERPVE